MKRALVLGGGGPVGVEWEAGLVGGLQETGFAFDELDVIVGTSAGAYVGAYLARGSVPGSFVQRDADRRTPDAGARANALFDRTKFDMQAMGAIFKAWAGMQLTTQAEVQVVGKLVRGLDRSGEDAWIEQARQQTAGMDWPERRLCVVAVDTETGERRVFERGDGVPLARAVAASSAVPGVFPAVQIEGRIYMDGQIWSSTNADLLVADRPEQVLIAMPTNAATGRGIGPHAERMLALELAALRAVGCEVRVRTPSPDDTQRMGANLMDYARRADAYAVGLEAGRAWGEELRT